MEPQDVADARQKALDEHRQIVEEHGSVNEEQAEPRKDETVVPPTPAPDRHEHGVYDVEAADKTVEDADFEAEEKNEDGDRV